LRTIIITITFLLSLDVFAQKPKVQNDPIHDDKPLHFGFSLGFNTMDFKISLSETARSYSIVADVAALQPGFHVHALSNLRLGEYFDLRFLPGISFGGERHIEYVDRSVSNQEDSQTIDIEDIPVKIESNFLEFPLLIKYKSVRLNNFRPFLIGGINTRVDLAGAKLDWGRKKEDPKKKNIVLLNLLDGYYEIGVGMDFYLRYFKFAVELKSSWGIRNIIKTENKKGERPYPAIAIYTDVIDKMYSRMVLISFHFE
jgi:hypothetical protein